MSKKNLNLMSVEPAFNTYLNEKCSAKGIPLSGHFELTTRCNLDCKMCYVHNNANKNELTAEEWIRIGKEASKRGMMFLLLTGGEPFLRKDFKEIYSALSKMGLMISINTNGSYIEDEMFDFLKHNTPTRMNISLYGSNNETYERLCGQPVFSKVLNNIIRLKEIGIQVKLSCSVTPYNEKDIEELYEIAKELELPLQATSYMFPPVRVNGCNYGDAPHRFSAKDAARAQLKCAEQYLTSEQIMSSYNPYPVPDMECIDSEGASMHCRAGKTAFWVTWDGRMLPCGMLPNEGISILKEGFDIAWNKARNYAKKTMEPIECGTCPKKKQCVSCVASCIAETGSSVERPEYICQMTQYMDELKKEKYL